MTIITNYERSGCVGRRLRAHLAARGWTRTEIARRAKLPASAVCGYAPGDHVPSPDRLHKLAATLGVKPNELLPSDNVIIAELISVHASYSCRITY